MNKTFKRLSLLVLVCLLPLFFCGCQGMGGKSPNQRSVAQAMALDLVPGDKPLMLTLRVLDAESSPEEPDSFQTVQARGNSITSALGDIGKQLGKDIFLRDIRVVLLGDSLCRSGIDSCQSFLTQSYQIRPRVSIAAVQGEAARLLQPREEDGEASIDSLTPLLEWENRPGNPAVTVMELERERNSSEGDCILPYIAWEEEGKAKIAGTAVFTGGRLSQKLNSRETDQLHLLAAAADPRQTVVHIPLDGSSATFRLTGKRGRIHGGSDLDGPRFTVKASFEFQLLEFESFDGREPDLPSMEQALEEHIKEEMAASIQRVVFEGGADVMGLAAAMRRDSTAWWNRSGGGWRNAEEGTESAFQKSIFLLNVDCRITQTDISIPLKGK